MFARYERIETWFVILDCACIAAVASLAHFKRPDVTATGDGVFIIHTPAEKELIPIVLHHYPICSSYALFNEGKIPVADPTALEERVSEASLVLAVNSYKELCCMHLAGVSLTSPNLILRCSEMAAVRSRRIVELIKSTLEDDGNERLKGNLPKGFAESIKLSSITSNFRDEENVENIVLVRVELDDESDAPPSEVAVEKMDAKTVVSGEWEKPHSTSSEDSSSEDEDEDMASNTKVVKADKKSVMDKDSGDSSEEDEIIVLK